jgi:hypothetical protein
MGLKWNTSSQYYSDSDSMIAVAAYQKTLWKSPSHSSILCFGGVPLLFWEWWFWTGGTHPSTMKGPALDVGGGARMWFHDTQVLGLERCGATNRCRAWRILGCG